MNKAISVLLALLMVLSLAACGDKNEAEGTGKERQLVAASLAGPNTFSPFGTYTMQDQYGFQQVYDTLLRKDEKNNIVPSLAEKYEMSDDGYEYTFYLTKGVMFSNGEELKAEDVKYTFEKLKDAPYSADILSALDTIEVVDKYTVKFKLSTVNVGFLEGLATVTCAVLNKTAVEQYQDQYGLSVESTVGTGPYILTELDPGNFCILTANENYFRGAPNIKSVKIKTISDINAAVIALKTREIDYFFNDIPALSKADIEASDNLKYSSFNSLKFYPLLLNNDCELFSDVRVRQALAYAIDREKASAMGLDGEGAVVNTPAAENFTGNPNTIDWPYQKNLEKAAQLIDEAGVKGETLTIKTQSSGAFQKIATSLQDDLNKAGLNAQIELLEANALLSDVANGDYQACIISWNYYTADMGEAMTTFTLSPDLGAAANLISYSNPEFDELVMAGSAEIDTAKREKIYEKAGKILVNDVPMIPLFFQNASRAYSSELSIEEGNVQYSLLYDFSWAK